MAPVVQQQQQQYGANLGPNPTANAINTPFLPVNSVNHPMPTSALYGAQQTTAKPAPPIPQPTLSQPPSAVNPSVSQTALNQNANHPSSSFFNPQAANPNPTTQTIQGRNLIIYPYIFQLLICNLYLSPANSFIYEHETSHRMERSTTSNSKG